MKSYKELSKEEMNSINGGSLIGDIFEAIGRALVRDGLDSSGNWTQVKYGSWNM